MSPSAHGRSSIYATYPGAERATCCGRSRLALPYSVLLRLELARFTPRRTGASSLWRWSSPRGGRVLPASLLCGARTFLGRGLSTDAPATIRPPPGPPFYRIHPPIRTPVRPASTPVPTHACRGWLAGPDGLTLPCMPRVGSFGPLGSTTLPSDPIRTRGLHIWPSRRPHACHPPTGCMSGRVDSIRRRWAACPGWCRR